MADDRQHATPSQAIKAKLGQSNARETFILQETYKSQLNILVEGLKILAWANGGAAVALLTLLGSLIGRCSTLPNTTPSLVLLAGGLGGCILGFFLAYFTQLQLTMSISTGQERWMRYHKITYWLSAIAIFLSVAAFIAGTVFAASGFVEFRCKAP